MGRTSAQSAGASCAQEDARTQGQRAAAGGQMPCLLTSKAGLWLRWREVCWAVCPVETRHVPGPVSPGSSTGTFRGFWVLQSGSSPGGRGWEHSASVSFHPAGEVHSAGPSSPKEGPPRTPAGQGAGPQPSPHPFS